jgi:nitrate/nitrite-specific signal transduction histidine kinase
MSKSPVMRAKIDQFVNHIKKKETRKQIAPIASAVGLALMVAAVVLFILSIVGWFVPGIDGGNMFTAQ